MYLIPFPAILKLNFPISRLKKWQIPRPETALLGPLDLPFRFDESWILTVIRVPYVGDGYIFESMKSAEIWNRGHKNKHGGMSATNFFVLRCCWASCTVGVWSTFGNIHVLNPWLNHILNGLCVEHVSRTYRDSLIYDLFNVKVFVFVRNKIHSAHMELMIVLGLYDLLSLHIIYLGNSGHTFSFSFSSTLIFVLPPFLYFKNSLIAILAWMCIANFINENVRWPELESGRSYPNIR